MSFTRNVPLSTWTTKFHLLRNGKSRLSVARYDREIVAPMWLGGDKEMADTRLLIGGSSPRHSSDGFWGKRGET